VKNKKGETRNQKTDLSRQPEKGAYSECASSSGFGMSDDDDSGSSLITLLIHTTQQAFSRRFIRIEELYGAGVKGSVYSNRIVCF